MQNISLNRIVLSLVPLFSFLYTSIYYVIQGESFQIFWLCNILNLVLFVALFFNLLAHIWSSTILLLIGMPLWLYEDVIVNQVFRWNAFFVHVVAAIVGLMVMRTNLYPKYVKTISVFWLVIGILLARIFTDFSHNVNLAYFVYPTLVKVFPSFLIYSLFNFISFFIGIWALDKLLKNKMASVTKTE